MSSVLPRLAHVTPTKDAPRVSMTPRRESNSVLPQIGHLMAGLGTHAASARSDVKAPV
jgi:hypothetical protein